MKYFSLSTFTFGVLMFLWMGVIFAFSSFPGTPLSFDPPFWYFVERKGAHVFEYALLMFLAFCFFYRIFPRESFWKNLSLSVSFCLMYAVSDELHQFFVPYRGSKMTDVLFDALGIFITSLFFYLLSRKVPQNKMLLSKKRK